MQMFSGECRFCLNLFTDVIICYYCVLCSLKKNPYSQEICGTFTIKKRIYLQARVHINFMAVKNGVVLFT